MAQHGQSQDALEILRRYSWPGNVRELRNVIERAFVLEASDHIAAASLPFDLTSSRPPSTVVPIEAVRGLPLSEARERFERALIVDCLGRHGGSITLAAKELQVPRSTIYRKLEALGVSPGHDE
jgi:DNA-binding NtrC family response regulator